jgi:predicted RNase H-like HicB family nuclease
VTRSTSPAAFYTLLRRRNPATPTPSNTPLQHATHPAKVPGMSEIIFEVREDEADGGFVATALGHAIATQGDTVEELRTMVRDAVRCHFGDGAPGPMPQIIRLHFVRDEALAV